LAYGNKYLPTTAIHRPPSKKKVKVTKRYTEKNAAGPAVFEYASIQKLAQVEHWQKLTEAGTSIEEHAVRDTFHVTLLSSHSAVKKCYGCEAVIKPIHDLILKNCCHRGYFKKNKRNPLREFG